MTKLYLILAFFLLSTTASQAFLYEMKMLSKAQIAELSDVQIQEAYLEAKIEERASAEFHEGAGFSNAKEYTMRKTLLRYIIDLRKEMRRRELEVDPVEEWLN